VDTNFINISIQNKLEIIQAAMDCLFAKCMHSTNCPSHAHGVSGLFRDGLVPQVLRLSVQLVSALALQASP
jgi:hypothetical protein